jgi:hypothetical protein
MAHRHSLSIMNASDIIQSLGGAARVAAHLGIPANTVTYWRHRNSIPASRWLALTRMDGAAEAGITIEALAARVSEPV